MSIENLPDEIIELIAIQNPSSWFTMVQIFRYIYNIIQDESFKYGLEKNFLIKNELIFKLPNRLLHTFTEPCIIWSYKIWYKHGKIHRDNNEPALLLDNIRSEWYHHGELHRDNDLPAIICGNNGSQIKYNNRIKWYHQENNHCDRYWYKNGKLHRDNDLPAVIHNNGHQRWYSQGKEYEPSNKNRADD